MKNHYFHFDTFDICNFMLCSVKISKSPFFPSCNFSMLKLLQLTCISNFQEMWLTLVKLLVISFSTKFNPVGKNISAKLQVNFVKNPLIHNIWIFVPKKNYNKKLILKWIGGKFELLGILVQLHSMAKANLNKNEFFLTNTTTTSKYIPKRPRICINWYPPFQTQIYFVKVPLNVSIVK